MSRQYHFAPSQGLDSLDIRAQNPFYGVPQEDFQGTNETLSFAPGRPTAIPFSQFQAHSGNDSDWPRYHAQADVSLGAPGIEYGGLTILAPQTFEGLPDQTGEDEVSSINPDDDAYLKECPNCERPILPPGYKTGTYRCKCLDPEISEDSDSEQSDVVVETDAGGESGDDEPEDQESDGEPDEYDERKEDEFPDEGPWDVEEEAGSEAERTAATSQQEFDGTTLTNVSEFSNAFGNVKEARAYLKKPKHLVEVDDDDVEKVKADQVWYARRISEAMRTLPPDASDTDKKMFETIQRKKYSQDYYEARCFSIVDRTMKIHKRSSELVARIQLKVQRGGVTVDQCEAGERLEALIDLLYHKKTLVKDVLEGFKWKAIVDQPGKREMISKATSASNVHKYQALTQLKAENKRLKGNSTSTASTTTAKGNGRKETAVDGEPEDQQEESEEEREDDEPDEESGEVQGAESGEETGEDMEVDLESDEELSSGDEIVVTMQPSASTIKKTASAPNGHATRSKAGKSVAEINGAGNSTPQARAPKGGKRKRAVASKDVDPDSGDAAQGGRKLRPRHR